MTREDYNNEYDSHQCMRDNVKRDKNRLHYHLMPPAGWLNDPNGLCQKDGIYHIYFQYSPYTSGGETKLWGHYSSKDLLVFKEEEPFLFPDSEIDRDGAYSGSAIVENGIIHYFYTGNVKKTDRDDYDYINEGREQNTIHMTSQDGINKSKKELVMSNKQYPENMTKHVRDPKILKKDGCYYMALGARTIEGNGCVILYKSLDLEHFEYYNIITTNEKFGYMWECPDLFELDGHLFLVVCPQGVEQNKYDYENVHQSGYYEVNYNFRDNQYTLGKFKELDHGFDYYAPQSFVDENGRRIQFAWMGIPDADYHNKPTVVYDWQHALTMPRLLTYKNGQIYQQPLEEMKSLREREYMSFIDGFNMISPNSICFEMNIDFYESETFKVQLRDDVYLSYENNLLTLSLSESGCGRTERHIVISKIEELTIFSDTSSLEIFINGGQEVMTTRVYSQKQNQHVKFLTENKGYVRYYLLKDYVILK